MSATLEKLMMLKQMNAMPGGQPLGMSEEQRHAAQGDSIMRIAAEMGRTGHKGSGFGRALSAMNASINPALDAYNQAEQNAMAENVMKQKMAMEQEREAQRQAMDILKEERAYKKEMRDEAYNRRYLDAMEKRHRRDEEILSEPTQLPEGIEGVPYSRLTKQERASATKRMQDELDKAITMGQVYDITDKVKKLLREHPDLSEYMSVAATDPEQADTFLETLKRNAMTPEQKKQYSAAVKFKKLTADLALRQAQAQGGKNQTDSLRAMILDSKPVFTNPYEANMYVLDNIQEEAAEGIEWEKALRYGLDNQIRVTRNPAKYREKSGLRAEEKQAVAQQVQPQMQQAAPMQNMQQENPYASLSDEELMAIAGGQ